MTRKLESRKDLVNEKATRHDIPRHCEVASHFPHWALHNSKRHCEEGKPNAARRSNLWKECEKLFREHAPALLPLSFRNNISHTNHYGTSQSLINVKHLFAYSPIGLFALRKRAAFTLAEVLITLAVIGIVAAMTIPTVMNKYNQILAETRLKLFYSTMNNAIALSEIDNGYKTTWDFNNEFCKTDSYSEKCITTNFEKFYKPYLKISSYKFDKDFKVNSSKKYSGILTYLPDGSLVVFTWRAQDIFFYPIASNALNKKHQIQDKDYFVFTIRPTGTDDLRDKYYKGKGMEPYIDSTWDGNDETLRCSKRAQLNGWKFPDDCNPFK